MEVTSAFITLGISLGLGLLVGMQRERANTQIAGIRTFALITVLGSLTAMLSQSLGGWIVAAGLLGVAAITTGANLVKSKNSSIASGATTEIAAILMFAVGAYLVLGSKQVGVVLGGLVAVLLYAKPVLHGFVRRIGDREMNAMMQLVLVALIILPVLPNKGYGPFHVINPRETWGMVVLVTGISFGGYIAMKLLGPKSGAVVAGLLGGMISSTATTMSYARRASNTESNVAAATLIIMLATTVVYVRVLFEVSVAAPSALADIAAPISIMLALAAILSFITWRWNRNVTTELPPQSDPMGLKSAIVFGVLFTAVSLAVAAAKFYFNNRGVYAVAGISGLTDMDAITLSTSRMVIDNGLSPAVAWRAIMIATMANLVFKIGVVAAVGGRKLLLRVALLFSLNIAGGLALLLFWPAGSESTIGTTSAPQPLDSAAIGATQVPGISRFTGNP